MRISLCGAAGEVTGSGYLVQTDKARVLVDFGMFQGRGATVARNRDLGPVEPSALDAVVLTHAHLDHTGRLPLLPSRGLRGPIHATPATVDFARLILEDSARLQESDAARQSRRLLRAGREPVAPLYQTADVEALDPLFSPLAYGQRREIADGIEVRLVDAGHILGSASVEMTVREGGGRRVVVFSGDVGLKGSPIVRDPAPPDHADLVFLESTYGDRDHRPRDETLREFREILERAVREGQRVLVPAFAIGRAQEVLYRIDELVHSGQLPEFPIYLDSPLAIEATRLYAKHRELFDAEAEALMHRGPFLGDLTGLKFVATAAESKALNDDWDMAVILAGSGMCDGGRIVHHLRHSLWRRNVAVLIVGYQAEGTLGRRLVQGAREVRIFGEKVVVRASIHTLGGFSAHAGQAELVEWVGHMMAGHPRVVLTHGEPPARDALKGLLSARFGVEAECPGPGGVIDLDA
jgi:metallo-beta-lactamase family protein